MTSKAERKRRSRARRAQQITLPGGVTVQAPAVPGQHKPKEDARKTALQARLRVAGIPDTPDTLKAAVAPSYGHSAGLCIHVLAKPDEATQLWDTFCHLAASYRNYMALYVGQTGNPKCAAIAMIPDPMETDPGLRVDLRSHDEKVAAAKASWAAWERKIAALPFPQLRMAIGGVLRGFLGDGTLWRDGQPTDTGRTVVTALRGMV